LALFGELSSPWLSMVKFVMIRNSTIISVVRIVSYGIREEKRKSFVRALNLLLFLKYGFLGCEALIAAVKCFVALHARFVACQ
jgi:hypothetical protein